MCQTLCCLTHLPLTLFHASAYVQIRSKQYAAQIFAHGLMLSFCFVPACLCGLGNPPWGSQCNARQIATKQTVQNTFLLCGFAGQIDKCCFFDSLVPPSSFSFLLSLSILLSILLSLSLSLSVSLCLSLSLSVSLCLSLSLSLSLASFVQHNTPHYMDVLMHTTHHTRWEKNIAKSNF